MNDLWYCRLLIARHLFFPYRLYEWTHGADVGPARWQWPDILRRPIR